MIAFSLRVNLVLFFLAGLLGVTHTSAQQASQPLVISDADVEITLPVKKTSVSATPKAESQTPFLVWRDAVLNDAVAREAAKHRIDPLLIHALISQESGGRARARSPKGAVGIMQLMPRTGLRFGVSDRYSINDNVRGGVAYLVWLLDYFAGDVALALAAYNSGEGAVIKYGRQIPPYRETQDYVRNIARRYQILRRQMGAQ